MVDPQISAWALAQGGAWALLVGIGFYATRILWRDLRAALQKREGDVEKLTTALIEATAAQREMAAAGTKLAEAMRAQTEFGEQRAEAIDDFRAQARALLERLGSQR